MPDEPALPARATHTWGRWLGRIAARVARVLVLIYLGIVLVLYLLQTRLIFPGAQSRGTPDSRVDPPPGAELVRLQTADGTPIVALFAPALEGSGAIAADAHSRPTLLFFYGNGMFLQAAAPLAERFRRLGMNVLIPEYVGYGMSGGSPGEAGCLATAFAAYAHLSTRADIDPNRIVAGGWSLGGAVAVDLAARRKVAGLIVFSTFTSMTELAGRTYPFLPTRLLLRHRFESLDRIREVSCPVLIGHGRDDSLVPEAMSRRLAEAVPTRVERFVIPGADHNDFFEAAGAELDARLVAFLKSLE